LEFLPDYFQPTVSKVCGKEIYRRKLHDIKKQEISPGEGMDRTYRKKFLVRSSRDACSVFGSPYSPLRKFEMRREEE